MHQQVAGLQLQARGDGQAGWRCLQPPSTRLGRARGQGTGPCWLKTEQCPRSGPLESEMSLCLNDLGWIFFLPQSSAAVPRLVQTSSISSLLRGAGTDRRKELHGFIPWDGVAGAAFCLFHEMLPPSWLRGHLQQPRAAPSPAPRPGSPRLSFPGHRALLCSAQEMPNGSCPLHPAPLAEDAPAQLHALRRGCQAGSCWDFYHGKGSFPPDSLPDNSNFQ